MHNETYADGVGEITITGSIVRINLMSLSPTEIDEHGNAKAVFRQRVVMPVDAFANAVELMQKAFASLVESGAIRRVNDGQMGSVPPVPAPERGTNASPNFN
ncbi:hypothetical protein NGM99_04970 [Mesorhizobium sp. RP14(2022)]|uniref:Uncharacterized protein n=1 Tax=Mesorhizobium liriopis TaxID=2953882 RepID=A0ABT1C2U7_9HYPH|nr:hypothetical protein [Mesorhizobium liriopis]MCO6049139.1 hypothetical protein [Mesorhizobium liriopis]